MAFNDLTEAAQEGMNYAASQLVGADGAPIHATGRAYMDALADREGVQWYNIKVARRRERRGAKLDDPANATLAAQVDALPDVP